MTSSLTTWWCGIPCVTKCQNMSFMTCLIQLQWEKWLENNISDKKNYKNDYNWIGLVVKDMFWHCGGNEIFDY
jgi:hypothetical protein